MDHLISGKSYTMQQLYRKIAGNAYGLYKALRSIKIFPEGILEGKNIAVVGAAGTALNVERGDYIESFDCIIRMNRAVISWSPEKEQFIGKRTDILLHNFFENDDTGGGGVLDIELFQHFGVRYLLQPRIDYTGIRTIINFYKKYRVDYSVYTSSITKYLELKKKFGKFHPTIGFYSMYTALTSNCNSVYFTGFTFFLTSYQGGYRSSHSSAKSINDLIKSQGHHSPDLELELFLSLLAHSPAKKIILDEFLYDLVLSRKPELSRRVVHVDNS